MQRNVDSIRSVAWAEAQSAMNALNMCPGVTSLQPAVLNFVKIQSQLQTCVGVNQSHKAISMKPVAQAISGGPASIPNLKHQGDLLGLLGGGLFKGGASKEEIATA